MSLAPSAAQPASEEEFFPALGSVMLFKSGRKERQDDERKGRKRGGGRGKRERKGTEREREYAQKVVGPHITYLSASYLLGAGGAGNHRSSNYCRNR